MVQWLRVLIALRSLGENLNSAPATHSGWLMNTSNSSPELLRAPAHNTHTDIINIFKAYRETSGGSTHTCFLDWYFIVVFVYQILPNHIFHPFSHLMLLLSNHNTYYIHVYYIHIYVYNMDIKSFDLPVW